MSVSSADLQFYFAIRSGDLAKVTRLLSQRINIPKGSLAAAVENDHQTIVELLLSSRRCDVEQKAKALYIAMEWKRSVLVIRLLREEFNYKTNIGIAEIPLLWKAVEKNFIDVTVKLLDMGASPNGYALSAGAALTGNPVGKTVLMIAAEKGREEIVRLLLEAGADPWVKGEMKKTALELIAKRKDRKAVAALLLAWMAKHPATVTSPRTSMTLDLESPFASWEDALARLAKITGANEAPHPQARTIIRFPVTLDLATSMARSGSATKSRFKALETYRQALRSVQGLSVNLSAVWFLQFEPAQGAFLCGLPKAEKWKVLGTFKTACINFGVTHAALLKFLRSLAAEQPFELVECDSSTLGGHFVGKIKNPDQIAKRLFDFCPLVAEDDGGSVMRFAKTLARTGYFKIWWD